MSYKNSKRKASRARKKMLADLLARADEPLLFAPGAMAAIRQSLAELPCYRCKVKYGDHGDSDHLWAECADDLDTQDE